METLLNSANVRKEENIKTCFENATINNKTILVKKFLDSGNFGFIYDGENIATKQPVVIKFSKQKNFWKDECKVLYKMKAAQEKQNNNK